MMGAVGFVFGWDQSRSRAEKMWVTLSRRGSLRSIGRCAT